MKIILMLAVVAGLAGCTKNAKAPYEGKWESTSFACGEAVSEKHENESKNTLELINGKGSIKLHRADCAATIAFDYKSHGRDQVQFLDSKIETSNCKDLSVNSQIRQTFHAERKGDALHFTSLSGSNRCVVFRKI